MVGMTEHATHSAPLHFWATIFELSGIPQSSARFSKAKPQTWEKKQHNALIALVCTKL